MSGFTSLGKKTSGGGGGGGVSANALGPFGTPLVAAPTPVGQAAFVYGINTILWTTGSTGTGASVSTSEGVMSCTSGNSLSGSASVKLSRGIKYRAGQGAMCRLTAIFDPGQPDTKQLAGVGNNESGYYFCMNGTSFGILHRETSKREIRSFKVTAQNAVTVTVRLQGESKSFSITGGSNANQTAYAISRQDYMGVGSGWRSEASGDVVYFVAEKPGPMGGVFDITVGGVSIVTVAATVRAGVLPTDTFIPQSAWNIDTMDGNGPSRTVLDTTKGNIYAVGYQWLGFGDPVFSMENPESGLLEHVHRIQTANARTSVVIRDPMTTARWEAINSGSSASSVTVKGASAAVFNEGDIVRNIGIAYASGSTKSSIGATEVPVITLRADGVFNSQCSYGEVNVFDITLGCNGGSSASNKFLRVNIYKNMGLGGPVNFQKMDPTRSVASLDSEATSVTPDGRTQLIKSVIVAANASVVVKLAEESFSVREGDSVTVTAVRAGASNVDDAFVTIGWFEDQ
jgi:hypothetical protein